MKLKDYLIIVAYFISVSLVIAIVTYLRLPSFTYLCVWAIAELVCNKDRVAEWYRDMRNKNKEQ